MSTLWTFISQCDWFSILKRIKTNPEEVKQWVDGKLPIHAVCQSESVLISIIDEFIRIYPKSLSEGDLSYNRLPIHYALSDRHYKPSLDLIYLLINKLPESVQHKDKYLNIPLLSYISTCNYQSLSLGIVQLLVTTYPDSVHVRNLYYYLPIHFAVFHGHERIINFLIKKYPGGLISTDLEGKRPIDHVKERKYIRHKLKIEFKKVLKMRT